MGSFRLDQVSWNRLDWIWNPFDYPCISLLSLWLVLSGLSRDLGIEVDSGSSRFDLLSNLLALAMDFHTNSPCEIGLDSRFELV